MKKFLFVLFCACLLATLSVMLTACNGNKPTDGFDNGGNNGQQSFPTEAGKEMLDVLLDSVNRLKGYDENSNIDATSSFTLSLELKGPRKGSFEARKQGYVFDGALGEHKMYEFAPSGTTADVYTFIESSNSWTKQTAIANSVNPCELIFSRIKECAGNGLDEYLQGLMRTGEGWTVSVTSANASISNSAHRIELSYDINHNNLSNVHFVLGNAEITLRVNFDAVSLTLPQADNSNNQGGEVDVATAISNTKAYIDIQNGRELNFILTEYETTAAGVEIYRDVYSRYNHVLKKVETRSGKDAVLYARYREGKVETFYPYLDTYVLEPNGDIRNVSYDNLLTNLSALVWTKDGEDDTLFTAADNYATYKAKISGGVIAELTVRYTAGNTRLYQISDVGSVSSFTEPSFENVKTVVGSSVIENGINNKAYRYELDVSGDENYAKADGYIIEYLRDVNGTPTLLRVIGEDDIIYNYGNGDYYYHNSDDEWVLLHFEDDESENPYRGCVEYANPLLSAISKLDQYNDRNVSYDYTASRFCIEENASTVYVTVSGTFLAPVIESIEIYQEAASGNQAWEMIATATPTTLTIPAYIE